MKWEDLRDAIKGAAELAGIDSLYSVRELPAVEDPYTKLLSQLSGDIRMNLLKKSLENPSDITMK